MKSILVFLVVPSLAFSCSKESVEEKPHIFLIYVDDLRPEIGAYGNEIVQTPHLDALGEDALIFNKAYANIPVCGASRASMLTGLMPNRTRFMGYLGNAEEEVPDATTIPAFLKQNGYRTLSFGKVFHTLTDSEHVWSEPPYRGPKKSNKDYVLQENIDEDNTNGLRRAGFFEIPDTTDDAYLDGKIPLVAIPKLKESLEMDSSLFIALGFWKPHLPFNAPKQYWDLYDPVELPYPINHFTPQNAPEESLHQFDELRSYTNIPNDSIPLDSAVVRKLIHGYYAATSYMDAQVGKFIKALKEEGIYDESLILLVGDHGWFLGEHTLWCKHANYRNALRTALMVKFPGNERKGMTQLPVGLVELYPTLADLLDAQAPDNLHAESLLPWLDKDESNYMEKEVYCRYGDGETLIKGGFAYTEYYTNEGTLTGKMLYDHSNDLAENVNVVHEVDDATVADLSESLLRHINRYK
ncbi:MAG: sulfatase [Ekhidna sp.]